MFPWATFTQKPKATAPREIMLERLREGVPPELAARAAGIAVHVLENPKMVPGEAIAEGTDLIIENFKADMAALGARGRAARSRPEIA